MELNNFPYREACLSRDYGLCKVLEASRVKNEIKLNKIHKSINPCSVCINTSNHYKGRNKQLAHDKGRNRSDQIAGTSLIKAKRHAHSQFGYATGYPVPLL